MTYQTYPTHRAAWVRPYHSLLVQFPVVCFALTLVTDVAYWQTLNLMWQNFSSWLLFFGLLVGGISALVGIVELLVRPAVRHAISWAYVAGSAVVLVLALINSLVHAGDGWTAVMPWGLALSALTLLAIIVTGWFGWRAAFTEGGRT